jgi:hypothetical protein
MKPQATNQEILLFTGTSFCNRPFCERDAANTENRNYSSIEELEKACWDGLLNELLPELIGNSSSDNRNYIWHTASGVHFLCINISIYPTPLEKETSLDPYCFFSSVLYN